MKAIIELEKKLALRQHSIRYCCGSDSQVALACLVKGRSSSKALNRLLQGSLATYLGANLVGNYGYVPSLANEGDDPTRNLPVRSPAQEPPEWWISACNGDFKLMYEWLRSLGYDPISVAKLPFETAAGANVDVVQHDFLADLRRVQKPERLAEFDRKHPSHVSQPEIKGKQELKKTGEKESDDQTKTKNKRPQKSDEEERPTNHFVASKEYRHSEKKNVISFTKVPINAGCPHVLSAKASALLAGFSHSQFFYKGKRAAADFRPTHRGFLDLYSGRAEVAKQLSLKYGVWVLTFDYDRGVEQDLLQPQLQHTLRSLVEEDAFYVWSWSCTRVL